MNFNGECCVVCGSYFTEVHHVFFGTGDREISDKHGFICRLCPKHHRGNTGVHGGNRELDLALKRHFQAKYEEVHSRAEFMALIGRNYL